MTDILDRLHELEVRVKYLEDESEKRDKRETARFTRMWKELTQKFHRHVETCTEKRADYERVVRDQIAGLLYGEKKG